MGYLMELQICQNVRNPRVDDKIEISLIDCRKPKRIGIQVSKINFKIKIIHFDVIVDQYDHL